MINILKKITCSFILLSALFFIACTDKNSNIGFPGTNFTNYEITIPDSVFHNLYTYKDSLNAFTGNTKLILGNYNNTDTRILIRFINIPKNVTLNENPTISFSINKKHNPGIYNIKVAQIDEKIFMQNYATWEKFNETEYWTNPGGDFSEPFKQFEYNFTENDSLIFEIDKEIAQDWIDKDFLENYGLIIYTENIQDSFIEFYSTETLIRPQIHLNYKKSDNTDLKESRNASFDTFIHNKSEEAFDSNSLFFSNLPPRSIFTEFNLPYQLFEGINSEADLQKININQAFLIFSVNNSNSLMMNNRFNIGLGIPFTKTTEIQETFDYTEMWLYPATIDSLKNDKIFLNITGPIQQFVSKNRPNNGLCFINNHRNMDFSHLNIFHKDENDIQLRPKILIRYSVLNTKE